MKPGYKQTEVGVIPEDWEVKSLGDLANLYQPQTISAKEFTDHGYPVYGANGVVGYYQQSNHQTPQVTVTCRGSTCGTVNRTVDECWITGNAMVLNSDHNKELSKDFFYYLLLAQDVSDCITGTGQPQIVRGPLAAFRVALPNKLPEQRLISEALSDVDGLLGGLDRLIAKKRDLKQAAMQQLLTAQTRLPGFHGKWEVRTLFELAERKKELFDDGDWIESEHITTEGIRLIQTGNIGVGCFIEKDAKKYIYEKSFTSLGCKQLREGDLLICRLADPAGRACVLPDIGEARIVTSVDVTIFRPPAETVDRVFLLNVFSTPDWFSAVSDRSGGTTHKRISRGALGRIEIKLPPKAEQTAIAEVLGEMDEELAVLERRREKTRALKQAMMQQLLTGQIRLVPPVASNVIPVDFTVPAAATAPSVPVPTEKKHNWAINEAVVVAVLVKHFGSEKFPLRRKRCTKLSYLLHRHVEHVAQGYLKKAAGPYNPDVKYRGPEGIAQKNGYIRSHKNGNYSGFVAADKIAQAETYFEKWYGPEVLKWLTQFRFKSNDDLECLATVDMAMEELRRAQKEISLASVRDLIASEPEWAPKLDRAAFSDENIGAAIQHCTRLFP